MNVPRTWQFGDRKSQSRIVLSNEPERNVSSMGDIHNVTTLLKYLNNQQLNSEMHLNHLVLFIA